jgi:hypothetical protein
MNIRNASDKEFERYGKVLDIDTDEIVDYLQNKAQMPEENNLYVRDDIRMKNLKGIQEIHESVYGLGDIEVGYCNGYNSKLNCMEYHTCPEVDIAADDQVLLLATQNDIQDGILYSKDVKAFRLKKGQAVLLYPYTLHFSPCKLNDNGFRCAIILTDKTNMDLVEKVEDVKLWKVNKWLLAHKDTKQATLGAYVGIVGDNLVVEY